MRKNCTFTSGPGANQLFIAAAYLCTLLGESNFLDELSYIGLQENSLQYSVWPLNKCFHGVPNKMSSFPLATPKTVSMVGVGGKKYSVSNCDSWDNRFDRLDVASG